MYDNGHTDERELGQKVADAQTGILLKLVFDLWEGLEKYDHYFLRSDSASAGRQLQTSRPGVADREDSGAAIFPVGFRVPMNSGQLCSSAAVTEQVQDQRRWSKPETQAI